MARKGGPSVPRATGRGRARREPRKPRDVRLIDRILLWATVIAGVYSVVSTGRTYGAAAAVLVALIGLGAVGIPIWAIQGVAHDMRGPFPSTRRNVAVVGTAIAISLLVAAAALRDAWPDAYPADEWFAVWATASVSLLFMLLVGFLPLRPADQVEDAQLIEPTAAWPVTQFVIGLSSVGGAAFALLLPLAAFQYGVSFDYVAGPTSESARTFVTEPFEDVILPILSFGVVLTGAAAASLLSVGVLRLGIARSRRRRMDRLEALADRVEDHYASGRLAESTYRALMDSIHRERRGDVPGEDRFVRNRIVMGRTIGLAVAIVGVLLIAVLGISANNELGAPADGRDPTRPDEVDYGPYCYSCRDAEEYDSFLEQGDRFMTWVIGPLLAMGLYGAFVVAAIPGLVRRSRGAAAEVLAFWEARDRLKDRMLDEVRAASASTVSARPTSKPQLERPS